MTKTKNRLAMLLSSGVLALPMLAAAQVSPPTTPIPPAPLSRDVPAPATPGTPPALTSTQMPGTTSPAPFAPSTQAPGTASADLNRAAALRVAAAYPAGSMMAVRMRMTQIIGSKVYNDHNEAIGEIDDIVLHGAGTGAVAVLQIGGFLGLGGRLVAVPLNDLMWNRERERVTLAGATKESLQSRPAFEFSTLRQG